MRRSPQVWNRGGVPPPGMDILTRTARRLKPEAVVWRGDTSFPRCQQGVKILGVPVGQPEFVVSFLERKSEEHSVSFQRIPAVEDPQAAWLLLLMCASTRANWDSLPQAGQERGLTGQVGPIASPRCTSATPQWQRPWCKGWPETHLLVLMLSERAWNT